ncbi:nucleoside hydrolase [Ruania halotolerans]|uniref:nucleoside hydrolase n=1 Tax=Ruania halotolerans TaxID=2897773 RepID=UPI001E2CAB67|nr:nucleoside hydrolase [Ruania halotolerans]UFU05430.1 nucleoside hydrolase [Ruania halotolerans]
MTTHHSVVLDTDLGTDVDDAMALALLLGSPEVELPAVTTVYGDTLLRARLVQRYAGLAGRRLPVWAGEAATRSGREVWWAGHEGSLHPGLEAEHVEPGDGAASLAEAVASRPGRDVLAIGPLTNLALALERTPSMAGSARGFWLMGGDFAAPEPEHNIRSDTDAAAAVFNSGAPIVICGLEITRQVRIESGQLAVIAAAGPLGAALAADIDQWWKFWNETWNVPHDPVAVLALLRPELVTLSEPGRVYVSNDGVTTHEVRPDGNVRVVVGLDAPRVAEEIVTRIVRAGEAAAR